MLRKCFVCGGDIEVKIEKFGYRKTQKRIYTSNDGILITNKWICNHCYKLHFKEFFKGLLPFYSDRKTLNKD